MPTSYIFCPSKFLNKEKINIPENINDENVVSSSGALFIAADSGIETALKFNIKPNILIGDFDSSSVDLIDYDIKNTKIIKYPAEKDDTDSMLAVKYSLENGYKNIVIIGGLDGRIDHTLVNLFYLKYIHKHGGYGSITNGYNKISYLSGSDLPVKIYKYYKYVSVISVSPEISGVTLKGFRYNLSNAKVKFEEPYTVCNEISNDFKYGEVKILNGEALICECDDM